MTTSTRIRHALGRALKADEIADDARGWAINLAIFRIVILTIGVLRGALTFLDWTVKVLPGISREMWLPISFFRLVPVDFLGNIAVARGLAIVDILLIILGIAGYWTRTSIAGATLISLYGFGLMQNLGKVDHESFHLIWFMALLAVGPSGEFLSIDAIQRAMRQAGEGTIELPAPPGAALWTLRFTWLLMGTLYFVTGLAKLQSVAMEHWAGAANLRMILWAKWLQLYWYDSRFIQPIRVDLLPGWVLTAFGLGVVAFEIGFVLIVFFRRLRPALCLWGLAFHVGNGLVLHIWFTGLMWAYASLIDWTAIGRAVTRKSGGPLLIFYDGSCTLCRRAMSVLRSFDLFDALRPIAGAADEAARNAYPQITDAMLALDLYAADGDRTVAGYDAYLWIAKRLWLLRPLAPILQFPPVAGWGRKIYRGIAGSRHCTIAAPKAKARTPTRPPKFTPVLWVGAAIFFCQLGFSSVALIYRLRTDRRPPRAHWLRTVWWRIDGIGKRGPVWPFDLYPTFTPASAREIEIGEARWVTPNGERRVSSAAYDRSFGNAPLSMAIATGMLAARKSDRGQARWLDLVQLLWRNEIPEVRRAATAVNVYRTEYAIQPPDRGYGELLRQKLLASFAREIVSNGEASSSGGAPPKRLP